jgi:sec-independent protein translocase protein TatB
MGIEMIFIFLLALILFGPKKLPEMAREAGKFVAEFKRASNDFKYQLQSEIENAGTDSTPAVEPGAQPVAQQTTSFTQTLLPPAVKSAISDIDTAHERLMRTARMAFDAQNFALRPPETPVVASTEAETPTSPTDSLAPASPASASGTSHESAPVETVTDQPMPDPAPTPSSSAPRSS